MQYYVYILSSNNKSTIYVGVTNNLLRRLYEHANGLADGFTKRYHVHRLIYYEVATTANAAIEREKQIKGWSRKRKEALIATMNPEWNDLTQSIQP